MAFVVGLLNTVLFIMENCEYMTILRDIRVEQYEKNTWKPLMRQCLVTSGVCCVYFLQGLFLGAPTVLVAQIRQDANSTEIISDEMLSWLTTLPVISAVPSMVVLPLLFNRIGRKLTFIFVCLAVITGFIIFHNSTNLYHVLIGTVFAGPAFASTITISPVIIAEYTSPKYRGIFLSLKSATALWGIWVSNAIGTFFHWRNIAIVAFVCSVHMLTVLVWPESPYWLAKRSRYIESAKSHRWLKGVSENSEKELAQLIVAQKDNNSHSVSTPDNLCCSSRLLRMCSIITSRTFYKPVIICFILIAQYNLTGKIVICLYAIDVLKHLTPDESFVYKEMLILDGVTVFSMYVGCVVSRYFKRRTLLLLFSGTGIAVLYILSLYLYLVSLSVVKENDIVILLLLIVFSIAISCGPMILCTSICGELIPPHHQNIGIMCIGLGGVIIMSVLLKLSPFIFKCFKMYGAFFFFGISSTILLSIISIHLPETKDKTIEDIEKLFNNSKVRQECRETGHRDVQLNRLL